jgi:hypothetical protein
MALEFPELDTRAPTAMVEQKPAEPATLKGIVLASFGAIKAHCSTLAERYRGVAFDLKTPKGLTEARAARHELREDGRYAVQRLQKALKDEANDLKRTIDGEAESAIKVIRAVEDALHSSIEAREAEIEAEKERARQAEAARVQNHQNGIAVIRGYLELARQPDMTAARIANGIAMLERIEINDAWEEFAVPAANALCETLESMRKLHAETKQREQEAARIEAQRLENERIAAELAEQQRVIAEQTAALARQQQEIEAARQRAEAPAANVATAAAIEGKADNPEPGKLEAAPLLKTPDDYDDIPSCPGCGAMAGCCGDYPNCPGGQQSETDITSGAAPQQASDHENPEAEAAPGGVPAWFSTGLAVARARDAGVITEAETFQAYEHIRTECAAQEPRAGSSVESTDAPAAAHAAPDYAALELELVDGPLYEAEALSDTARDRALDLHVLLRQARTSAFPSQPKMPPEWWSAVYLATDALQAAFGEVA